MSKYLMEPTLWFILVDHKIETPLTVTDTSEPNIFIWVGQLIVRLIFANCWHICQVLECKYHSPLQKSQSKLKAKYDFLQHVECAISDMPALVTKLMFYIYRERERDLEGRFWGFPCGWVLSFDEWGRGLGFSVFKRWVGIDFKVGHGPYGP